MCNDRWVRIIDPKHILRVGIDEEWHSAYDTYGWKSEIIIDGITVGACAAYKFRCRLCDVPDGIKIVDPGPDHELLDPWETESHGNEDWWNTNLEKWCTRSVPRFNLSHSFIYRRPTPTKFPDQFAAKTAAFRKARETNKTPQSGEWWFNEKGDRVFIHGVSRKGEAIYECMDGNVSCDDNWEYWHHEFNCTGWDWQPEAQLQPLTLERRLEEAERKIKELGRLFQQWEPRH